MIVERKVVNFNLSMLCFFDNVHIFLFLANEGYTVYKSVPYGTIEEVLPYLSRRVAENRSVLAGARKERQLLSSEIRRRLLRQ